jgi:signal transduction histidine kinase
MLKETLGVHGSQARGAPTSQVIGRRVDHMTHLINDLLDMSRVT